MMRVVTLIVFCVAVTVSNAGKYSQFSIIVYLLYRSFHENRVEEKYSVDNIILLTCLYVMTFNCIIYSEII